VAFAGGALAAFFAVAGCTSTVTPPRDPQAPVTVLIIADEKHRRLCLPDGDKGYVEFGFGDWSWYALGNDRWYHVFATVLVPTAGTLSRREFAAADPAALRAAAPWAVFQELRVGTAGAEALRLRLEQAFADRAAETVWNGSYRMRFLPWTRKYWFASTCADQLADWLRELGCHVSWVPIRIDLAVAQ
jgi:hypothetical protein